MPTPNCARRSGQSTMGVFITNSPCDTEKQGTPKLLLSSYRDTYSGIGKVIRPKI